jgi:3-mercaptopyruvate sulfurtransferase SseA
MRRRYLVTSMLTLLALFSCAPTLLPSTAPTPPINPAPTPSTPPEATSIPPPSVQVPRMTKEELLQKIESNADIIIVDTRVDVETQFTIGHIKGAIPVTLAKIMAGQWLPPSDKEIILYCS